MAYILKEFHQLPTTSSWPENKTSSLQRRQIKRETFSGQWTNEISIMGHEKGFYIKLTTETRLPQLQESAFVGLLSVIGSDCFRHLWPNMNPIWRRSVRPLHSRAQFIDGGNKKQKEN